MSRILWILALALAFGAPAVWAGEVEVDYVLCSNQKLTMLESGPDITAYASENWGIVASTKNKAWENATQHCMGIARVMEGKLSYKGLCKTQDTAGNTRVAETEWLPAKDEGTWTLVTGTGKFKGAKGSGFWKIITSGKPIEAGTAQFCNHVWGKITLP